MIYRQRFDLWKPASSVAGRAVHAQNTVFLNTSLKRFCKNIITSDYPRILRLIEIISVRVCQTFFRSPVTYPDDFSKLTVQRI